MGMSVGGIGSAYAMSFVQPMNYALRNESDISEDFAKNGAAGLVTNVSPVGYPNAQAIPGVDDESNDPLALSANVVKKSQEANRQFNDVASRFQGMTTGYDQSTQALSYGMSGNSIDLFA